MTRLLAVIAGLAALAGPASAQQLTARGFDRAFNAAAQSTGMSIRLTSQGCAPSGSCEFIGGSRIRVTARGEPALVEAAFYITPASTPTERRSAGVEATKVITVLGRMFRSNDPNLSTRLLDQAIGPSRRGSARSGNVEYVLSATQPDNLRVYATVD